MGIFGSRLYAIPHASLSREMLIDFRGSDRAAIVPTSLAAKSGLLESQVQVNEKYGGGYLGNIEGLHHLHCLNLLRQSLYYNYAYYQERKQGAFKNNDDVLHFHVCKSSKPSLF
jgi:Mycotoxin biosynthesis protein UstYa